MEEPQLGAHTNDDWSVKTGEALRALRTKLVDRQEADRHTANDAQADIIARIFQITEEMALEQSAEAHSQAQLMEEKLVSLEGILADKEELITEMQSRLGTMEQDKIRLQNELQQERISLEQSRSAESSECKALTEKLIVADQRAEAAEKLINKLTEEVEQAAETIAELEVWRENAATQDEQAARLQEDAREFEERCIEFGAEVERLTSERDALAEELAIVQSALDQQRIDSATGESNLSKELENTQNLLEIEQLRSVTAERERDSLVKELTNAESTISQLNSKCSELESRCQSLEAQDGEKIQGLHQDISRLQQERDALVEELAGTKSSFSEQLQASEAENQRLEQQVTEMRLSGENTLQEQQRISTEHEALARQLAELKEQLAAEHARTADEAIRHEQALVAAKEEVSQVVEEKQQWEDSRNTLTQQLADSKSKLDELTEALQAANTTITGFEELHEELEQTRKKFELALADSQKLKRENAALQEELARRPEANEQESPELVSLRMERDALASRVSELESSPPPSVDEDTEQRLADLQRRFELAVDDLRQVKQEKARLEEELANVPSDSANAIDSGAMDWQSQKARLLASLESDDDEEEPTP